MAEPFGKSPAVDYFRIASALSAAHLLGIKWPPADDPSPNSHRSSRRFVGHWGCNPGLAWAVGHVCQAAGSEEALDLIVGTGHASSFMFAHTAIREGWSAHKINARIVRYGQPGGDDSEHQSRLGRVYIGGELGPCLAVSSAYAGFGGRVVVSTIGDGEAETPVALAALIHHQVIRGATPEPTRWLPVINANGFRMGGPAGMSPDVIETLLRSSGFEVVISGTSTAEAAEAASTGLDLAARGRAVAWISVTPKGFGAPPSLGGRPFDGERSHKLPPGFAGLPVQQDVARWMKVYDVDSLLDDVGRASPSIRQLAQAARIDLGTCDHIADPFESSEADPTETSPMAAIDRVLASSDVEVFSPDEALSNRLIATSARSEGVIEVLSEELCLAWAWGSIEAGRPAVVVTYEAFAPLFATMVAQYNKLLVSRADRHTPALVLILTSLGWANTPTHQNGDLASTFLNRPDSRLHLHTPSSAAMTHRALRRSLASHDSVHAIVCSKQDIPTIGSFPQTEIDGLVLAVGDIAAAEAGAASEFAEWFGLTVAVETIECLTDPWESSVVFCRGVPLVAVAVLPSASVSSLLWSVADRVFLVLGPRDASGPSPWETLRANKTDRTSIIEALVDAGLDITQSEVVRWRAALDELNRRCPAGGWLDFDTRGWFDSDSDAC